MKAHENWKPYLLSEMQKDYYHRLVSFLKKEQQSYDIFPNKEDWFNSLSINPEEIKVVILGQDPYFSPDQAHGFSFSVPPNIQPPPSLINIYKEIEAEFNVEMSSTNGNLLPWVKQGILLLNSVLTVRKGEPASHKNQGWEQFTDRIIEVVSENYEPKVFMLWGAYAKSKEPLIDKKKNLVLTSSHPSPRSADYGFFGNGHFKKANIFLENQGMEPINWVIEK